MVTTITGRRAAASGGSRTDRRTAEAVLDVTSTVPRQRSTRTRQPCRRILPIPGSPLPTHSRRAKGFARQAPRREAEAVVRNRAAELSDELIEDGCRVQQVAQRLHAAAADAFALAPPASASASRPPSRTAVQGIAASRAACRAGTARSRKARTWACRRSAPSSPTCRACELQELQADYRHCFRATHRRFGRTA